MTVEYPGQRFFHQSQEDWAQACPAALPGPIQQADSETTLSRTSLGANSFHLPIPSKALEQGKLEIELATKPGCLVWNQ